VAACTYCVLVVHLAEGVDGKKRVCNAEAWCRLLSFERKSTFVLKLGFQKHVEYTICRVFTSKLANCHYLIE